jgi:hypothetical protein
MTGKIGLISFTSKTSDANEVQQKKSAVFLDAGNFPLDEKKPAHLKAGAFFPSDKKPAVRAIFR